MAAKLDKMTKEELLDLRDQIDKMLIARAKAEFGEAKKAAEDAAKQFGYSLAELVGVGGKPSGNSNAPAKYRNPANKSQTWSGRGRQPAWFKEGIEAGMSRSDFAI